MSAHSITSLTNLSRHLTRSDSVIRSFRLPRVAVSGSASGTAPAARPVAARRAPPASGVVVISGSGPLPEMTSDLAAPLGGYVSGNVRRAEAARPGSGAWKWSHLVGRLLGGETAARW